MSGCKLRTTGPLRDASVLRVALLALVVASLPRAAATQTQYYNLDSGRPLRVEDALPTERRAFDFELAPLRLDAFSAGNRRWRADPKISYGAASLTEVELRVPVLLVHPGAIGGPTALGLTTIGVGALRAVNTETQFVPAMAVSAEVLIPAGSLAPPKTSYAIKGLLTKTMSLARISINGAYGTYSVRPAPAESPSCRLAPPGTPGCDGRPSVPDVPCARLGADASALRLSRIESSIDGPALAAACLTAAPAPAEQRTLGGRWFAGLAIDHTFPLSSTLVVADLFAERFIGLTPFIDWTGEVGVRHQWSPQLVLDAGVARHFAGATPSTAMIVGATYSIAIGRHRN